MRMYNTAGKTCAFKPKFGKQVQGTSVGQSKKCSKYALYTLMLRRVDCLVTFAGW